MHRPIIILTTAVALASGVGAQSSAAPSPLSVAVPAPAAAPPAVPASTPAPPAKPAESTAPVTRVPPDKIVAILGQPVIGPLGAVVGRLVDVLVGQTGQPQAAVIDFGGFMGVGSRKIAVHWNTLHFNPGDPKYPIVLDLLPAQIKAAPSYKGESKPAPVVVAPWEQPSPTAPSAQTGASR